MTCLNLYQSIKDIRKEKRNFWYDRCQPVFLHSQNFGVPGSRNKVDLVAQLVEHPDFIGKDPKVRVSAGSQKKFL